MRKKRVEIELEEAIALLKNFPPIPGREILPLALAHGRVLAEDQTAEIDQPPFDRSPLDGYALRAADTLGTSPQTPLSFAVVDRLCAGDVPSGSVGAGQAVRLMTGAMLPPGSDAVIKQEETDLGASKVRIYRPLSPHENVCFRGEDFKAGSLLLGAGTKLDAPALGALASAGVMQVPVRPCPRVALLVTGNELWEPVWGQVLPPGKIYSSNLTLLSARLGELGYAPVRALETGDDPQTAAGLIREILEGVDVLLTTGGVSVGDNDLFHEVIPLLGAERVFHGVKLKPGTPAMLSRFLGKPILSLSGNPFAAAATFELLARPLLFALSGDASLCSTRVVATLAQSYEKKSPVRRFVRGRVENGEVTLPEGHSSGQLRSLVGCNCLVEIPPDVEARQGDLLTVYLI